jgi:hypothetical protein
MHRDRQQESQRFKHQVPRTPGDLFSSVEAAFLVSYGTGLDRATVDDGSSGPGLSACLGSPRVCGGRSSPAPRCHAISTRGRNKARVSHCSLVLSDGYHHFLPG